jgi:hypothetical protein
MKIQKLDWLIFLLLFLLAFLFFLRFFFPQPQLLFTPDLGRSDLFHFNFIKRYQLVQAFQHGRWPLWNPDNGTGVPLLAEGQIGTFHLVNLLTAFLLPFPFSFNFSYVLYTFTALTGTFLLGRYLYFSRFVSLFVSLAFSFSGFFVFRLTHTDIYASAVFLPWAVLFTLKNLTKPDVKDTLFLSLIISQIIAGGHSQIAFVVIVGLSSLVFFHPASRSIKLKFFPISLVLAFLLIAAHFLPLLEFTASSVRQRGLNIIQATENSFSFKDLANFIYPFIWGNPATGTYPLLNANGSWNIFWEKGCYLGPLILLLVLFWLAKRPFNSTAKLFGWLTVTSFLLALGRYSPLFFVYLLPPFSFFRNPARFILLTELSLIILAGYGLQFFLLLIPRRLQSPTKLLLLLSAFLPSWFIFSHYHLLVPVRQAMERSESANYLVDNTDRLYTVGAGLPYLQELLHYGWSQPDYFLFAKNSLDANLNVLFHQNQAGLYDGLLTQRQATWQKFLQNEIAGDFTSMTATASALHQKLLNLTSTRFLLSPFKITDPQLHLQQTFSSTAYPPFFLYENADFLPRFRLLSDYQVATGATQAFEFLQKSDFDPRQTVVLEKNFTAKLKPLQNPHLEIRQNQPEKILLITTTDQPAFLVVADSYTAGWQARVDQQKVPIYPANFNQRAVFLPAGEHQVEFRYCPLSFQLGLFITCLTGLFWLIIWFKTNEQK